jgi:hypothetical protein
MRHRSTPRRTGSVRRGRSLLALFPYPPINPRWFSGVKSKVKVRFGARSDDLAGGETLVRDVRRSQSSVGSGDHDDPLTPGNTADRVSSIASAHF